MTSAIYNKALLLSADPQIQHGTRCHPTCKGTSNERRTEMIEQRNDNNDSLFQITGPYHRRNHTTQEHKNG